MNAAELGTPQRHREGWLVPSASLPDVAWYVELGETVRCTCPGWVHRRTSLPGGECRHIKAVRELMRKEVAMG
jgi:hypothetical protein